MVSVTQVGRWSVLPGGEMVSVTRWEMVSVTRREMVSVTRRGDGQCYQVGDGQCPGVGVDILDVKLQGVRYLEVGSGVVCAQMRLQGAHDDPVVEVSWLLCSLPVSWTPKRQPFRLLGLVNASPTDEPHNIHFTQVEYSLAGNFTCEVSTANDVARQTYFLHVVDAFSSPYKTNVHVFEMINNSSGIKEENKFQYEVDGSDPSQNVNFENAACTLVWTFSTPAIFPRPNVTCGYYSLTMMMLSTAFLPASPCTSLIMVPGRPPLTLPILSCPDGHAAVFPD
ncbi:hypothetical protein Hamer_G026963 [Homarus americanus]|uniref:Ig-like domain-containing protein n=1 Tax=Homarus americanus TaxID=6706 RepID=A0A8J5KKA5_HOMAM|nr:hypothetical protein Hamer_G026963 [Homarus americanus]